ncbi:MAG: MGMT family protein [Candidatus Neomarinimicrobiota bacterium]
MPDSLYHRVYAVVRCIPSGRVATYGQVAAAAGLPGPARLVGYALHNLPHDSDVPWHRVVSACGGISLDEKFGAGRLQRALLAAEGVTFHKRGGINLERYQVRDLKSGVGTLQEQKSGIAL